VGSLLLAAPSLAEQAQKLVTSDGLRDAHVKRLDCVRLCHRLLASKWVERDCATVEPLVCVAAPVAAGLASCSGQRPRHPCFAVRGAQAARLAGDAAHQPAAAAIRCPTPPVHASRANKRGLIVSRAKEGGYNVSHATLHNFRSCPCLAVGSLPAPAAVFGRAAARNAAAPAASPRPRGRPRHRRETIVQLSRTQGEGGAHGL
jgi:hypothetical protein